jgi:dTDP-4-dehydrorhamnose 3,5-epimerase
MKTTPLSIDGSWKIDFQRFDDNRGYFYESFKEEDFKTHIGRDFKIKQTNTSSSSKGSVRGIHFAMLPPSQAKLVQCQRGSIRDYVIDIRVGSPTFGKFEVVELGENPEREKGINPFDKTLNVKWPDLELILSEKDKQAISLDESKAQGLLPNYDECKKFIKSIS